MIKKHLKPIVILVAMTVLLSGCSNKKGASSATESSKKSDFSEAKNEEISGEGNVDNESTENTSTENISTADISGMDFTFSDRDLSEEYDINGATKVTQSGDINITKEGTYVLSGNISNTMITIEAGESDKIQILFNGVTIENENGPAIYVKSADKVFITLVEGTKNSISDGDAYEVTDGDTTLDAAIFSRSDLTINGKGTLEIDGNYKHGVVSKDDLVIANATLDVKTKNVGVCGKDCVKISGGNIDIESGSDGIRSDNTEDNTRGYVYIKDGALNISSEYDGVQAETIVKLENTDLTVKAGEGSSSSLGSSEESYKGIKAVSDILIDGGKYEIDSMDDCIHSNNTVSIVSGDFKLSSGDDGIHADTDLSISGGNIDIEKSYEGIEGSNIVISGGNISLVAYDDGINAAGGNDSSAMGNRPGQGHFSSSSGTINISGGYILVNSDGDGIDSNGSISVSGGVTLVSGPTNGGNGAFDFDGSATVTGGVLIALGSSGMAQGFSQAENQGAILCTFTTQNAGTSFALCDESGDVVVSFTPEKAYQCAAVTAPGIQSGNTYTIVTGANVSGTDVNGYVEGSTKSDGDEQTTIEMTSTIYNAGGMGGMGGNPGGMHGGGGRW